MTSGCPFISISCSHTSFVQLALEGYYEGCEFFRVVPGLCVQTGDASNSGEGGDSIYDEGYFDDE